MIESNGLATFIDQALVEDVQHFEERCLVADLVNQVGLEVTAVVRAVLAPDLQSDVIEMIAHL